MRDRDRYAQILKLKAPWTLVDVELDLEGEEVRVGLEAGTADQRCPKATGWQGATTAESGAGGT